MSAVRGEDTHLVHRESAHRGGDSSDHADAGRAPCGFRDDYAASRQGSGSAPAKRERAQGDTRDYCVMADPTVLPGSVSKVQTKPPSSRPVWTAWLPVTVAALDLSACPRQRSRLALRFYL